MWDRMTKRPNRKLSNCVESGVRVGFSREGCFADGGPPSTYVMVLASSFFFGIVSST